jgi:proteasome lid subunit RPN8/RPN11
MAVVSQENQHFAARTVLEEDYVAGKLDFSHLQSRKLMELSGPRSADYQIIIRQTTLERIHELGQKAGEQEICGVLIGDVYTDSAGPFLLVENVIPLQAEGGVGRAAFSQATWQSLQATIAREFVNRRIVGWYYTHPSQGPSMSALDRFLHDTFFNLPWQIAFSFDPIRHEEGVFSGFKGSVRTTPFLLEHDNPSKRMTDVLAGGGAAKRERKKRKSFILRSFGHLLFALFALAMFVSAGYVFGTILHGWGQTYLPKHTFH